MKNLLGVSFSDPFGFCDHGVSGGMGGWVMGGRGMGGWADSMWQVVP